MNSASSSLYIGRGLQHYKSTKNLTVNNSQNIKIVSKSNTNEGFMKQKIGRNHDVF